MAGFKTDNVPEMMQTNFDGAYLAGATLAGTAFEGASFKGADLTGCTATYDE